MPDLARSACATRREDNFTAYLTVRVSQLAHKQCTRQRCPFHHGFLFAKGACSPLWARKSGLMGSGSLLSGNPDPENRSRARDVSGGDMRLPEGTRLAAKASSPVVRSKAGPYDDGFRLCPSQADQVCRGRAEERASNCRTSGAPSRIHQCQSRHKRSRCNSASVGRKHTCSFSGDQGRRMCAANH